MSAVNERDRRNIALEYLLRNLEECRPIIKKLGGKDHKIKFEFYRFGDEVSQFDPDNPGKADGKRPTSLRCSNSSTTNYRGRKIHSVGSLC